MVTENVIVYALDVCRVMRNKNDLAAFLRGKILVSASQGLDRYFVCLKSAMDLDNLFQLDIFDDYASRFNRLSLPASSVFRAESTLFRSFVGLNADKSFYGNCESQQSFIVMSDLQFATFFRCLAYTVTYDAVDGSVLWDDLLFDTLKKRFNSDGREAEPTHVINLRGLGGCGKPVDVVEWYYGDKSEGFKHYHKDVCLLEPGLFDVFSEDNAYLVNDWFKAYKNSVAIETPCRYSKDDKVYLFSGNVGTVTLVSSDAVYVDFGDLFDVKFTRNGELVGQEERGVCLLFKPVVIPDECLVKPEPKMFMPEVNQTFYYIKTFFGLKDEVEPDDFEIGVSSRGKNITFSDTDMNLFKTEAEAKACLDELKEVFMKHRQMQIK